MVVKVRSRVVKLVERLPQRRGTEHFVRRESRIAVEITLRGSSSGIESR